MLVAVSWSLRVWEGGGSGFLGEGRFGKLSFWLGLGWIKFWLNRIMVKSAANLGEISCVGIWRISRKLGLQVFIQKKVHFSPIKVQFSLILLFFLVYKPYHIHFTTMFSILTSLVGPYQLFGLARLNLLLRRVHSSAIFALDVVYTHRPDGSGQQGRLSHVIHLWFILTS